MSNFEQIAAELGLSGSAVTMARCTVYSAQQWRSGRTGAGVQTPSTELADRRRSMIDRADDMVHTQAADILRACKRGSEYPRTLTAERLAEALCRATV